MSIIGLLLAIALVGVVTWLLITYVPMPPPFKTVILVVAIVLVVIVVLSATGIMPRVFDMRVPRAD